MCTHVVDGPWHSFPERPTWPALWSPCKLGWGALSRRRAGRAQEDEAYERLDRKLLLCRAHLLTFGQLRGWEEGRCEYILILQGANPKQTSFHALFDSQCRTTVEWSCETHMHKRNISCTSTHMQWTNTCHIWWICLTLWLWVVHSIHRTCNLHLTFRKQKVLITYHLLIGTNHIQYKYVQIVLWDDLPCT